MLRLSTMGLSWLILAFLLGMFSRFCHKRFSGRSLFKTVTSS